VPSPNSRMPTRPEIVTLNQTGLEAAQINETEETR